MSTALRLTPADRGRPMSLEEFLSAEYEPGAKYELIDGRLDVSPEPNQPHAWVCESVFLRLSEYASSHSDVINRVSMSSRVFVRSKRTTCPEPDIAVYQGFPLERAMEIQWQEISPILVVEVLGEGCEDKDLKRNVDLYYQASSIQEYWVVDIRDPQPRLIVHRRRSDGWEDLEILGGSVYATPLLPGFELLLDMRKTP
jgi:Uma2 family endonuclease